MGGLQIILPDDFKERRIYIINTLFARFLGLKFKLKYCRSTSWQIVLNKKKICFADNFQKIFDSPEAPNSIVYIDKKISEFFPEDNLPSFFGKKSVRQNENEIHIEADIFSSAFVLLTRYYEFSDKQNKDRHGRYPDSRCLTVKHKLHHRPIVDEYVLFMKNLLRKYGCKQNFKNNTYQLKLSHDIDYFLSYPNFGRFLKRIGGAILKRKNIAELKRSFVEYYQIKTGKIKDPYDRFEELSDFARNHRINSAFYFIAGKPGEADADYDINNKRVGQTIRKIAEKGISIGIHGSYLSYNNPDIFMRELNRLKKIYPEITEGRQHFLRFNNPKTWQIWNAAGLKIDSTVGFHSQAGFKAGTCRSYPVFDLENNKELDLYELPLIAMDTAMINAGFNQDEIIELIRKLKHTIKKYKGTFVFLMHNNLYNLAVLKSLAE